MTPRAQPRLLRRKDWGLRMGLELARWRAVVLGAVLVWAAPAAAATPSKHLEQAGTAIAIAMPIAAGTISLLHDGDWQGIKQLVIATGLTVGTAMLLKQIVHERRPDLSDDHSFPSETAALADSSTDYLWDRYGWRYGVPALLASTFVGYTRTNAKKHHWYDVAASGAIAFGFNYAIVTRYHPSGRYHVYADADPDGLHLRFAMNF